jgi:hypothetical protein
MTLVLLVSSLLTFLWMPEFHTTGMSCEHYISTGDFPSHHTSRFSSTFQDILNNKTTPNYSTRMKEGGHDDIEWEKYEHAFMKSKNSGQLKLIIKRLICGVV